MEKCILKHGDIVSLEDLREEKVKDPFKHLEQLNIKNLWDKGIKGKGVKVAVIDSGCDLSHPLLRGRIKKAINIAEVSKEFDVTDEIGHGTHVASLIGGSSPDGTYYGVAPECELMIYKVLTEDGLAYYDDIARAINAAIQSGAEVINLSVGGTQEAPQIHEAIKTAMKYNVSVVAACGNGGNGNSISQLLFPSCYKEVIEVGSIDGDYNVCGFSNSNPFVDCVVKGDAILGAEAYSTDLIALSGTSQSAPLVAGVIALLRQWSFREYGRILSEEEIYALLIKNTKKLNVPRNFQGHGTISLDVDK